MRTAKEIVDKGITENADQYHKRNFGAALVLVGRGLPEAEYVTQYASGMTIWRLEHSNGVLRPSAIPSKEADEALRQWL